MGEADETETLLWLEKRGRQHGEMKDWQWYSEIEEVGERSGDEATGDESDRRKNLVAEYNSNKHDSWILRNGKSVYSGIVSGRREITLK